MVDWLEELGVEIPENHKLCCECLEYKSNGLFSKDKSKPDGLNRRCKSCYSIYHKKNADSINERRRIHHVKYKDRARKNYKIWYKNNYDKVRSKHLQNKYGMNLDEFNSKLENQNHSCKICECKLEVGKHTHIDHDHATGKVRGILCHTCNTKLGWYEKNSENVEKYLHGDKLIKEYYIPSHAFLN